MYSLIDHILNLFPNNFCLTFKMDPMPHWANHVTSRCLLCDKEYGRSGTYIDAYYLCDIYDRRRDCDKLPHRRPNRPTPITCLFCHTCSRYWQYTVSLNCFWCDENMFLWCIVRILNMKNDSYFHFLPMDVIRKIIIFFSETKTVNCSTNL